MFLLWKFEGKSEKTKYLVLINLLPEPDDVSDAILKWLCKLIYSQQVWYIDELYLYLWI